MSSSSIFHRKQKSSKPEMCSTESHLKELEKQVTEIYPRKIDSLLSWKNSIAESDAFDDEDRNWVEKKINDLREQFHKLDKEYEFKNSLYNETLKDMEWTLEVRENTLNQVNNECNIFEEHPDLTKLFAKKQIELMNQTVKIREKIK